MEKSRRRQEKIKCWVFEASSSDGAEPPYVGGASGLTLHQQEESSGVFLEDANGLFCGFHDGRVHAGVPLRLVAQVTGFKQS